MNITITARHTEIPEDLRAHARELINRACKVVRRPQRAEVVFDLDHQTRTVELILNLPRGQTRVAKAEANDFPTALDSAVEKLRHQLDKDDPSKGDVRHRRSRREPKPAA